MSVRLVAIISLILLPVASGCESTTPAVSPSAPVGRTASGDEETPHDETTQESDATTDSADRQSEAVPAVKPEPPAARFRPPDERPQYNPTKLAEHGIRIYESRRLKLLTDIEAEEAEPLPAIMDALFDQWQEYFGPLPPARDGSDFQITGYLMRDQQPFRDAGLLPVNLPVFAHGRHDGQQFWMNDQEHPYYRRHLLLHEATHCFMQTIGGTTLDVPLWYLEGMAELFATHRLNEDGTVEFRVMPKTPADFVGFGRIEMIEHDIESGHPFTLPQLTNLSYDEFQQRASAYAWSWATCLLADRHPRYSSRFRELGRRYPTEGFASMRQELLDPMTADFAVEWTLFTHGLEYGDDIEAAAIDFQPGASLDDPKRERQVAVVADRGWQSTAVAVTPGETYAITASGRVTLAAKPKPWISEPDGITIRYENGQPLGRLLGLVIGDAPAELESRRFVSDVMVIGTSGQLTSSEAGTLYLRINDTGSELTDNTGQYDIRISGSRQ